MSKFDAGTLAFAFLGEESAIVNLERLTSLLEAVYDAGKESIQVTQDSPGVLPIQGTDPRERTVARDSDGAVADIGAGLEPSAPGEKSSKVNPEPGHHPYKADIAGYCMVCGSGTCADEGFRLLREKASRTQTDNRFTNLLRILKDAVGEMEAHGCTTGDCPHEKQTECDADLTALADEIVRAFEPLMARDALLADALAWIEKHHEMPGYSEFILRLRERVSTAPAGVQPGELRCSHGPYKIQGTTGCSNCEDGRVTLYYLKDLCVACENAATTRPVYQDEACEHCGKLFLNDSALTIHERQCVSRQGESECITGGSATSANGITQAPRESAAHVTANGERERLASALQANATHVMELKRRESVIRKAVAQLDANGPIWGAGGIHAILLSALTASDDVQLNNDNSERKSK